jgi:hypothetical protein
MLDGGSIPPGSTKSILQVREQRRNVFVDLATWNDSLLFALQYTSDGPDRFRQREITETATGQAKDLILAKQVDANDSTFALAA